ncbi:hypothetical protein [Paenibacillus agricola]|uniref:Uncharacterized protein n=1 Tax=Paenibacillus agricola TaxID=2716264 RepID=A0ABX0J9D1_9BACL|nr:hypothetical protein [Paenibacillus agricola]NHN30360.1 hypothetical protein [Paenibacillus agricola]
MFNLEIEDNIKLTLEVSENYLKNIIDERNDVKNYKMVILTLHNALELTFKFLLQSRDGFMIYEMQDSNSFHNVIKTYKRIHKQSKFTTEKMLPESELHTVSFTKAYEILAYLYNVDGFDEKFIFKLKRLNTLRNGLTHFKARIEHTDILVLYNLYEECVDLYNSEIDNDRHSLRKLINVDYNYNRFIPNQDLAYEFPNAIEEIKMKLLDEPIIKELIGFLIKKLDCVNSDIDLNDYEKLLEFFLGKEKRGINIVSKDNYKSLGFTESEFEKVLRESKEQEKKANKREARIRTTIYNESDKKDSFEEFVVRAIFMLLESDFIYSRTYYQRYESFDHDLMGGLSLTVGCKDLILKKWNYDSDLICKAFDLSQEEYYRLLKFQGDHDHLDSFDDTLIDYPDDEL